MTDMPELLPCPFCGDSMEKWDNGEMARHSGQQVCPLQMQAFPIAAWNRRATPDHTAAAVAAALGEAAEVCAGIRQRIAKGPMPEGARFDYEQSIRALTPADAQAALDRMLAEARADALREAAEKTKQLLEDEGIDLQAISDGYREAMTSGVHQGRQMTKDFAKASAVKFQERSDAVYQMGEHASTAILALIPKPHSGDVNKKGAAHD